MQSKPEDKAPAPHATSKPEERKQEEVAPPPPPPTPTQDEADNYKMQAHGEPIPDEQRRNMRPSSGASYQTR